jgi:hypothetical protein
LHALPIGLGDGGEVFDDAVVQPCLRGVDPRWDVGLMRGV